LRRYDVLFERRVVHAPQHDRQSDQPWVAQVVRISASNLKQDGGRFRFFYEIGSPSLWPAEPTLRLSAPISEERARRR
jgi:hypothetical protein